MSSSKGTVAEHQRIVVAAFITQDGRVLLAKRAGGKAIAPGKWHLPGGHVEFGEQPDNALARELMEELGVVVRVGPPIHVFSYLWDHTHTVGIVFRVELSGDASSLRWNPLDIQSIEWVSASDLRNYLQQDDHNLVAAEVGLRDRVL